MTGVQIIIVRLETLLLPFQRTKSSLLEYPFSLLASPTVRIVVPVSISLSLRARHSAETFRSRNDSVTRP